MYSSQPSFVLGFHGCDKAVGEKILAGYDHIKPSQNAYDWLGHGMYFWENNPKRALEHAQMIQRFPKRGKSSITEPFVIGAVIDLGYCLNLLESDKLEILKLGYEILKEMHEKSGTSLPQNRAVPGSPDLLLRNLDCAVIEIAHTYNEQTNKRPFDTVRAVFVEGKELYPNAGFYEKNHIQICVRNPNCIKGYFRPLSPVSTHPLP